MYQVPSEEFLRKNEIEKNKRGKKNWHFVYDRLGNHYHYFGFLAYRSFEKYSWSETKGKVTNLTYFESVASDEASSYYDYEYTVDGVTYTGSDGDHGTRTSVSKPPAQGETITVYYNPKDPSESLVNTNYSDALSDAVIWTLCCGPIFFLFGALLYYLTTRKQPTLQK
ncbi:MAG: hypothetical protein UZ14_CFX002001053 [Chloroflexi bacterium OLB14]|nr:MAG: hypothetical protein UZ14_CFX002001053 [Chloroflexi bacterium OLB14]